LVWKSIKENQKLMKKKPIKQTHPLTRSSVAQLVVARRLQCQCWGVDSHGGPVRKHITAVSLSGFDSHGGPVRKHITAVSLYILQQDNDPKHTSCQNYLRRKEQDGSLGVASTSPALNLMVLVWDQLCQRAKAKTPVQHICENFHLGRTFQTIILFPL
jgi:hypothetical protein